MVTAPIAGGEVSTENRSARDARATIVALLTGFPSVQLFDELPVGFLLNWEQAERAGVFAGLDDAPYGAWQRALLTFLLSRIEVA